MKRIATAVGLFFVLGATSAHAAQRETADHSSKEIRQLEIAIEAKMTQARVVGMAAAIVKGGSVMWQGSYGFADKANKVPFTPDTTMGIASVSKTFLGVLMMRAVEEGVLELDRDINDYLPFQVANPHRAGAKITLRHLATHTSGIVDRPEVYFDSYLFDDATPEPLERFLESYFARGGKRYSTKNFVNSEPGAQREYSNLGASLAGLIVERALGKKLPSLARRYVFEPLEMNSTDWCFDAIDWRRHTKNYVSHDGFILPIARIRYTTYPDGGVHTTLNDLTSFFIALLNKGAYGDKRILSADRMVEMQAFQFTEDDHPENFPLSEGNSGLFWRTKMNGKLVGHGGNDPGVFVEMLFDRELNVGVILLINTSLSGEEGIGNVKISEAVWRLARRLASQNPPP